MLLTKASEYLTFVDKHLWFLLPHNLPKRKKKRDGQHEKTGISS